MIHIHAHVAVLHSFSGGIGVFGQAEFGAGVNWHRTVSFRVVEVVVFELCNLVYQRYCVDIHDFVRQGGQIR